MNYIWKHYHIFSLIFSLMLFLLSLYSLRNTHTALILSSTYSTFFSSEFLLYFNFIKVLHYGEDDRLLNWNIS